MNTKPTTATAKPLQKMPSQYPPDETYTKAEFETLAASVDWSKARPLRQALKEWPGEEGDIIRKKLEQ